jgi:glycosyltransferase involved in cell wall biosynthesis
MKLLMITRKVDNADALAGFTYNWVKHIGAHLEHLYVITWQQSDSTGLDSNVEVISLSQKNKLHKILDLQKKLKKILPQVDGVFCHMNPEYTILSAFLAKLHNKKIVSWYTHRAITFRRRLLELLANKIITASDMSFRRPWFIDKVEVIGHGIDTDLFVEAQRSPNSEGFNIMSVGRISPTKDYESIIKAIYELGDKNVKLNIVGDVILESQKNYLKNLKQMVETMKLEGQVEFVSWVANKNMPSYYQKTDLFINMSGTGSVDKVVLEAMASGCLVLTSNEAFLDILGKDFMVDANASDMLTSKIKWLMNMSTEEKKKITDKFRQIIIDDYELDNLSKKIIKQF